MSTNVPCPDCATPAAPEDLNIAKDIALCRACNKVFAISAVVEEEEEVPHITETPKGAYYQDTINGWAVGATTRSAAAFFFVPFTLVWAGGSMAGLYGSQLAQGKFNLMQSLFGIPFLIGSIVLVSLTLMAVCGRIDVCLRGDVLESFAGVAGIGWRRRMKWDDIERISTEEWSTSNGRSNLAVCAVMKSGERKKIAMGISRFRLDFIHCVLATKKREADRSRR